jgi:hypothetical protein
LRTKNDSTGRLTARKWLLISWEIWLKVRKKRKKKKKPVLRPEDPNFWSRIALIHFLLSYKEVTVVIEADTSSGGAEFDELSTEFRFS